jgi:predicted nucleotidyltransferase
MVDQTIVETVRNYLRTVQEQGIDVRFGILFGSHSASRSDIWSDIDVLVVSPLFDGPRNRSDVDLLIEEYPLPRALIPKVYVNNFKRPGIFL